ncbi:DNA-binding transcriptional regulator ModE [Methanobrevibacter woesei]|uniref:DNA-binding transcriptional regulator ModE n=1 Tax=Methanobrevibacter woesei TaxID=190976 RepID=A0A2U1S6D3_9EURY|nr:TOBE domain-containing protein [Methanobrevibacter woesei]MCC9262350.1 TOBE domain-containing protein [Methanobrevibacter woesei]PWB85650.1 DNA-binding transcriptional regulator ModE [Methanobrevibacter woesei]
MTDVKADVEYKINFNDNAFLLDHKKFKLLEGILNTGSITDASKLIDVSYRTALNYINKIETALNVSIVSTSKGGKGGGGGAILTPEGRSILKECKKINAIMQLHRDVNEIETVVSDIDEDKGVMELTKNDLSIKIPLDRSYALGDNILALISYDNIFIMLEPSTSSIRNIIDGKIVEMKLDGEVIKVRIDVGGVELYSFITLSAEKDLNLTIGKTVYIGFKAMSVATLKL